MEPASTNLSTYLRFGLQTQNINPAYSIKYDAREAATTGSLARLKYVIKCDCSLLCANLILLNSLRFWSFLVAFCCLNFVSRSDFVVFMILSFVVIFQFLTHSSPSLPEVCKFFLLLLIDTSLSLLCGFNDSDGSRQFPHCDTLGAVLLTCSIYSFTFAKWTWRSS